MPKLDGKLNNSLLRKVQVISLSVSYGMAAQLSSFVFSALTVHFISQDFWGEYCRILLTLALFQVVCNWGSREYLVTGDNKNFRSALWRNVWVRLPILLVCIPLLMIASPAYAMFSALLLLARFFTGSFEILVYKERRFVEVLAIEVVFILVFSIAISLFRTWLGSSFVYFLAMLLCLELLKTTTYFLILNRGLFSKTTTGQQFNELKASFPFFINALVGFLSSRGDSLLALFYFNNGELAVYQIAFNLVFIFQALSNLIFYTYSFHFARLNRRVKLKVIRAYIFVGFLISLFFSVFTASLLKNWYRIDLPIFTYLLLSLFVLLSFVHQPYIYLIYQQKKTLRISAISIVSVIVFLVCLAILHLAFPVALFNNFILSAFTAQLFRSAAFYLIGKKYLDKPV